MSAPAVIFALEFLNAGMLWWLPAAAAPLVIHLLSRLRFREMPWAAVQYLLAALEESRRRIRLEQWLLLLLRTLLIVLVVAAVAQPRIETSGSAAAQVPKTHHLVVLDGSYSMAAQPTDKRSFDRAREIASEIVQQAPESDGFSLVLMSDRPRVVVGTPVFRRDDFLREVEQLELPHGGAKLVKAMAVVEEVLAAAQREAHRLDRHQVYFLTDLQRVTWDVSRLDKAAEAEFHERSRRLAKSAAVRIIDVGQHDAENVAVTAVRCAEPLVMPGQPVEIRADLKNFGRRARNRQPVELLVDGSRVQEKPIALPAGAEAWVSFSCRFPGAGDHTIEVRTARDPLEIDNHRFLVVPVKDQIGVLCVEGRPSGGAAGYLIAALAPQRDGAGRTSIRPEVVPESALLEHRLADYDCAILSNVAQFTASEAKALDAYLREGGNLIFFLGDRVRPENYNEQLGGAGRVPFGCGVRILPARLGPAGGQPEGGQAQGRLNPLGYEHPIVRVFRGREKAGLLTTPVYRHFPLIVPKGSKAQVALALSGGDPLIVEEPVHRGRVILVATSADASWDGAWTPFPQWPSFLPLVHEMLACVLEGQLQQRNVMVGEPLGGSLAAPVGRVSNSSPPVGRVSNPSPPVGRVSNPSFSIRTPSSRRHEGPFRPVGEDTAWSFADTELSGFYVAQFGPPLSRSETFAVNVDTAEGDLSTIGPDELQSRVWPEATVAGYAHWQHSDEEPSAQAGRTRNLSQGLIYAVLLLLAAETYLARRFGHPTP